MRAVQNRSQNLQGTGTRYSTNKNKMKILNPSSHKSTLIDSSCMVFHSGFLFTSTIENGIEIVVLSINGQKAAVQEYQRPMAEVSILLFMDTSA